LSCQKKPILSRDREILFVILNRLWIFNIHDRINYRKEISKPGTDAGQPGEEKIPSPAKAVCPAEH
jgi:hypothetical protein